MAEVAGRLEESARSGDETSVSFDRREGGGVVGLDVERQVVVPLKLLASGGVAGAVAKSATAPLARLTILYQTGSFRAEATSLRMAFDEVVRREGARSLWKGNLATVLHRIPYSAVSFLTYEHSTSFLQQYLPKDEDVISGRTDLIRRLMAGGLAGITGTVVAYPLDLVRTRLAAQMMSTYYSGIIPTLQKIIRDEGVLGMYKGLGATLLQVGPNLALNYCCYETLRSYWIAGDPSRQSPSLTGSLVCGGIAGLVSSTFTFPMDTVRRRMQLQGQQGRVDEVEGYLKVVARMWKKGGLRGFYAGVIPEYCKVMPSVAIVYTTFEIMKRVLEVEDYNVGKR
eukprot:evm.model.scf_362EXC.13 EVM.evm.TU.scf_362EXC.13   scf_362EXC:76176-79333(-)